MYDCYIFSPRYRHQPPDRNWPARQITEPSSASGGRAAPLGPCQGQDLSYGGGSARGEIGLFPARDKAAAGSSGSPPAGREQVFVR